MLARITDEKCAVEGFTIRRFEIPFDNYGEPIYLIPFGDVHRSSKNCHVEKWLEFLEWAKSKKRAYFIGMGDLEDFMSHSERATMQCAETTLHDDSKDTLEDIKLDMVEDMAKELSFMKGRLLGLIEGNHYAVLKDGTSTTQRLCGMLDCSYLGVNSLIRLVFRYTKSPNMVHSIDIFAHHGLGAARTIGGSINTIQKMADVAVASIYLQGHDHQKSIGAKQLLRLSDGNKIALHDMPILFVRTGSFLKAYELNKRSYVVNKMLPPANLGVVKIEITPKRKHTSAYRTLNHKHRIDERYLDLHASL